jgi:hypothetical protein
MIIDHTKGTGQAKEPEMTEALDQIGTVDNTVFMEDTRPMEDTIPMDETMSTHDTQTPDHTKATTPPTSPSRESTVPAIDSFDHSTSVETTPKPEPTEFKPLQ